MHTKRTNRHRYRRRGSYIHTDTEGDLCVIGMYETWEPQCLHGIVVSHTTCHGFVVAKAALAHHGKPWPIAVATIPG